MSIQKGRNVLDDCSVLYEMDVVHPRSDQDCFKIPVLSLAQMYVIIIKFV